MVLTFTIKQIQCSYLINLLYLKDSDGNKNLKIDLDSAEIYKDGISLKSNLSENQFDE